jgi:predicted alpha-1,2-mannosidase
MTRSTINLMLFLMVSAAGFSQGTQAKQPKKLYVAPLTAFVKPLIGTEKMGHTFPGATVPFGMVQLSPDTDTLSYELNGKYNRDMYKYCAGYQYTDKTIVGFSHTHFSGTGHSDLGDILIMPTTGELQLNPGTADHPEKGFRSAFSHDQELAEPNYYNVHLQDHNIKAELTTTTRVGLHRYTFPKSNEAHIILDLVSGIYNYENKNVWTFIRVENDSLITGYRQTNGWGRTRTVYFAIAFSKKFRNYGYKNFAKKEVYKGFWGKFDQYHNFPEMAGTQLRAYFDFDTEEGEEIQLKVALSSVSTEGALQNMLQEAAGWEFDRLKAQGQAAWNRELGKVQVDMLTHDDKINFYTALYHTMLGPTVYMDTDGRYRGLDQNIHQATGFTNYTTFSLWDTYRALHPLINLLQPERNSDMISSMLAHYDQSAHDLLPVWSHYANDNWCMIGYHSVSVIADAIIKGTNRFDAERALEACVTTARHRSYDGLGHYMDLGYVPEDKNGSSVSKTLEYAYDDWCIAQIAKKLGKTDIYNEFIARSGNYKNVFDPSIGFMRPRFSDGKFQPEFDVLSTHGQGFIEGNSWNYSLYVPHRPDDLIALMGGKKRFTQHLDSLFTMTLPDKYFAETEDISRDGIIGNYVHGNEPSHHAAYLFNWSGAPWKTQEKVRLILSKMYHPTTDGLGGNDDCGQMSAWYIFSAMGFYPVAPGSNQYAVGSPLVKNATILLGNNTYFRIEAVNQSAENVYVSKVELNGKVLDRPYITHEEIAAGGSLVFYMSSKPKKK